VVGKTNTDDVLKLLKTPNKSRQKLEDLEVCFCVCVEQIALSCLSLKKKRMYIYITTATTNGLKSKKHKNRKN